MADFAGFFFVMLFVVALIYYSATHATLASVQRLCDGHKGVQAIHEPPLSVLKFDKAVVICRDGTLRNVQ